MVNTPNMHVQQKQMGFGLLIQGHVATLFPAIAMRELIHQTHNGIALRTSIMDATQLQQMTVVLAYALLQA